MFDRLPSAVCRLPSAVCRYYNKINCLQGVVALIFCFSISPVAQAAVRDCGPGFTYRSSDFQAIVTPMEFNSMPNGSLVGRLFEGGVSMSCRVNPEDWVGLMVAPVSGAKIVSGVTLKNYYHPDDHYDGVVYTTSLLEERGLGFVFYNQPGWFGGVVSCYIDGNLNGGIHKTKLFVSGFSAVPTGGGIIWGRVPDQCMYRYLVPNGAKADFSTSLELYFVKIGNISRRAPSQWNSQVPLIQVGVYNGRPFPASARSLVASFGVTWDISNFFPSRVITRACTTPAASESVIDFGRFDLSDLQVAAGTVKAQREFTLTFTCKDAGYENISFFVEPRYGKAAGADGNNGVMRIAQGAGMARGVGVKLELMEHEGGSRWSGYKPVIYRTDSSPRNQMEGKYLLPYSYDRNPINQPFRQTQVKFRASLIRLPEPLAVGQIKAAALIHIRYN